MIQTVAGILHTRSEAEVLVDNLLRDGFVANDVSVLFPDKEGTKDFAHENSTKAPEGAATGAGTGGVLGGALGLAAGVGALAIPGMGPFIAAGPIMAALSGAAVGATVGGLGGALIGLGMPEYEAKMYEGKIRDGNLLVAVACADKEQVKRAEAIFKAANTADVHVMNEKKV